VARDPQQQHDIDRLAREPEMAERSTARKLLFHGTPEFLKSLKLVPRYLGKSAIHLRYFSMTDHRFAHILKIILFIKINLTDFLRLNVCPCGDDRSRLTEN
jgi:hypothetical protein